MPTISSQEFLISLFYCQKTVLVCEFSGYLFVQNDAFFKVPYILWVWDFVDMYLTHLETRTWSPSIHIYSKNWFFWPPKNCCTPQTHGKENMILKMLRNEFVWIGGHVDLQVSYKILWSKVPKKAYFCTICLAFKRDCFEDVLRQFWTQHSHWCLGVKMTHVLKNNSNSYW
jgi:hypothetical protein